MIKVPQNTGKYYNHFQNCGDGGLNQLKTDNESTMNIWKWFRVSINELGLSNVIQTK